MRYVENRTPSSRFKDPSYSPYTFQVRQIKPKRRSRWHKPLLYALLSVILFSIIGLPAINGLIIFFVTFAVCRSRHNHSVGYSRPLPHELNAPSYRSSEPAAMLEQPPASAAPEKIGDAIRDAGGIINYINHK